jgi:hypothetical protein
MTIKLETITKEREIHMENLWKEFQQVLHSFLVYTEEFRDEYIDLRNRDAEETRSIQDHYNGEKIFVFSKHRKDLSCTNSIFSKFLSKFHLFRSFKTFRKNCRS